VSEPFNLLIFDNNLICNFNRPAMKKKYILTLLIVIMLALQAISQNCNLIGNGNIETPIVVSTPVITQVLKWGAGKQHLRMA
jgi:hypothetical protein